LKRKMFLEKLNAAVPRPELSIGKKIDMSVEEFRAKARQFLDDNTLGFSAVTLLAALATEGSGDDRSRRTDFDFIDSSGRLAFLETVRQLMLLASPERLHAVLFKPWQRTDGRWSLRFDPIEDRRYALLDRDPTASDNKSRSEWMANLLAFRALSFFPCAITQRGSATTCWHEDADGLSFRWPLWRSPLSQNTIRSLLGHQSLGSSNPITSLRMLGVEAVYCSRRISNGDYVNFSPAFGL
jgi:hypothetical protein